MGESELIVDFRSEAQLVDFAGALARRWQAASLYPLLIGLRGDLGSGKTTWVRALLNGLGYQGRVPSPTYTLLEHYPLPALEVVHLDLYRLAAEEELENLGLRDWLAQPACWVLVEWPERAARLAKRCDLLLDFEFAGDGGRRVTLTCATEAGAVALQHGHDPKFNYEG